MYLIEINNRSECQVDFEEGELVSGRLYVLNSREGTGGNVAGAFSGSDDFMVFVVFQAAFNESYVAKLDLELKLLAVDDVFAKPLLLTGQLFIWRRIELNVRPLSAVDALCR